MERVSKTTDTIGNRRYWIECPVKTSRGVYKGWVFGTDKYLSLRDAIVAERLKWIEGVSKVGLNFNEIQLCPEPNSTFDSDTCRRIDSEVEEVIKEFFPGPVFVESDVDFTDYTNPC